MLLRDLAQGDVAFEGAARVQVCFASCDHGERLTHVGTVGQFLESFAAEDHGVRFVVRGDVQRPAAAIHPLVVLPQMLLILSKIGRVEASVHAAHFA